MLESQDALAGEGQSLGWVGADLWVDLPQGVEEGLKGGPAKVGGRAQAREQTPVQHLLEVPLTDVLDGGGGRAEEEGHSQAEPASAQSQRRPTHRAWPALTYQHGGPEVKLLSQLSDVDVHSHEVLVVILLHLPDDISQPLELPLGPCHPDEVYLGTYGWS